MEKGCISLQTVSNPGDTVRQFKSAAGLRDGGFPSSPEALLRLKEIIIKTSYSNRAPYEGASLRVRPYDLIYLYVTGGVVQN